MQHSEASSKKNTKSPLRTALVGFGLAILGILVAEIMIAPAAVVDPSLADGIGEATMTGQSLALILNFVGMALAGIAYLIFTDRGLSWIDLRQPTRSDWRYVVLGSLASLGLLVLFQVIVWLGVPAADSQVIDIVGDSQTMILIMIVIVFLFNAPAEEFLFRNVIQKRLYEGFSRRDAILVTSAIFAIIHIPMYVMYADTVLATMTSIILMFAGSVIFGYVYAQTENLFVPTLAHAVYNAVQFALLYLAIELGIEEVQPGFVLTSIGL